jgi:hypothetical protein
MKSDPLDTWITLCVYPPALVRIENGGPSDPNGRRLGAFAGSKALMLIGFASDREAKAFERLLASRAIADLHHS